MAAAVFFAGLPAAAPAQCSGCVAVSFPGPRTYPYGLSSFSFDEAYDVADMDGDGRPDVVLFDGASNSIVVLPARADGQRGTPISSPTNSTFTSVVTGDFDGDGVPDVIASSGFSSGFSLFRGVGGGLLSGPTTIPTSTSVIHPVAGDFDGDGNLDFAYTDGSNVAILLGNGDGTFPRGATIPVGSGSNQLITLDANSDGRTDILSVSSSSFALILGSATGIFAPATIYALGISASWIAAGDWDGDHIPDVVAVSSGQMALFHGTGSSFVPVGPISNVQGGVASIGDFTGTGLGDILLEGNNFELYAGDGAGHFSLVRSGPGWGSAQKVVKADLNSDGLPDVVYSAPGRGTTVVLSAHPGGLDLPRGTIVSNSAQLFAAGDFDGNQIADVAVYFSGAVHIFTGDAAGNLTPGAIIPYSASFPALYSGDADNDGKADILLVEFDKVTVFRNAGGGAFQQRGPYSLGFTAGPPLLVDLNSDGKPDLVVPHSFANAVSVLLGTGGGNFGAPRTFAVGSSPVSVVGADLDGDGKMDLAVATGGVAAWSFLRGDGAGGFLSIQSIPAGNQLLAIATADFDQDTHPDLAMIWVGSTFGTSTLAILRNNGTGLFTTTTTTLTGFASGFGNSVFLRPVDVNGDGRTDLALSLGNDGTIRFFLNLGPPPFRQEPFLAGGDNVFFDFGDFDGDGLPDLMYARAFNQSAVATLLNTSCRARHLGLSVDVPACVAPGSPFAPQPQIHAFDDGGNVVACAPGSVTASLVPGTLPPGAALGGTVVAPFASGTAAFTDLSVSPASKAYRIQFDAPFGRVISREFTAGAASPTISGPGAFCATVGATYDAGPGFDHYAWVLDGNPVGSGQMLTTGPLPVGSHTLSVTTRSGNCAGSDSQTIVANASPSATITRSATVCGGSTGNLASVPDAGPGATYAWTIGNGTITAGAGTSSITYTAGVSGPVALSVVVTANGCSAIGSASVPLNANCGSFFTVPPCRLLDTRDPVGPLGGPSLPAGGLRSFSTRLTPCGIPDTARSIAVNVTATQATAAGDLRLFPANVGGPLTSTVNYRAGQTRSNNAVVGLDPLGAFSVICNQSAGTVDLIVDVTGYFE